MSQTIKLKKGFDINIAGEAANKIVDTDQPETFALKPTDFPAIRLPKLMVKEGDNVKAGTPLMYEKYQKEVYYTSPVSGEVVEIKRGAKRKLLEIKILADKEIDYESFKSYSASDIASLDREEAKKTLCKSGVWPHIVQRPFGIVADPEDEPKAIFISGFDSHPNAPDMNLLMEGNEQYFQAGIDILKKFTRGKIHLNVNSKMEIPKAFSQAEGVELNKFSGAHPAGNVGVQIHHLDPINKGEVAWTVSPVGLVHIGKVFLEGKYDASKLVALTGSEIKEPAYIKTFSGACFNKLLAGRVEGNDLRYISGNVLTGENVGLEGYLGFYHNQISVLPEGEYEEFLGWIKPSTSKLSFHRAFGMLSFLMPKKEFKPDTNTHGEERGFVISGSFEQVMPMDILPTYLFKSIMAEDFDDMEGLGIYEVIEEDVALCEFIDPSKQDLQSILREGIDLIRNS